MNVWKDLEYVNDNDNTFETNKTQSNIKQEINDQETGGSNIMEKFSIEDAFRALEFVDEKDLNESYLKETEEFNIQSKEDMEAAKDFEDKNDEIEDVDIEQIIDIDADYGDPEALKSTYIGKAIIECPTCHSLIYKDKDLLIKSDEEKKSEDGQNSAFLYNIGEECPECGNLDGYLVIGEVAALNAPSEALDPLLDTEPLVDDVVGNELDQGFFRQDSLEEAVSTSATIPASTKVIKDSEFYGRDDLTSIFLPNGVTTIGDMAFYGCDNLISVIIPNSVTTIGDMAFYGCDSLKSITIPNSVTTIGSYAFNRCKNLKSIQYTGTKKEWRQIKKNKYWRSASPACIIHCKDGDIKDDDLEEAKQKFSKEDGWQKAKDVEFDYDAIANYKEDQKAMAPIEKAHFDPERDAQNELEYRDVLKKAKFDLKDESYQITDIDEGRFDKLVNKYLHETYENVENYKTTSGSIDDAENNIAVEGLITFKSGKKINSKFIFENKGLTKKSFFKFKGINEALTRDNSKAFILQGYLVENCLQASSLSYKYNVKTLTEDREVSGKAVLVENKKLDTNTNLNEETISSKLLKALNAYQVDDSAEEEDTYEIVEAKKECKECDMQEEKIEPKKHHVKCDENKDDAQRLADLIHELYDDDYDIEVENAVDSDLEEELALKDVKVGDVIYILDMPGEPYFIGREGVVENIDEATGELYGDWGDLPVDPQKDNFEIIMRGEAENLNEESAADKLMKALDKMPNDEESITNDLRKPVNRWKTNEVQTKESLNELEEDYLKKDAGNVEQSVEMFNHAMGADAAVSEGIDDDEMPDYNDIQFREVEEIIDPESDELEDDDEEFIDVYDDEEFIDWE